MAINRVGHALRTSTQGLEDFAAEHKLRVKVSELDPDYVSIQYTRDSDLSNPLVRECRNLVLKVQSWMVVAWGFVKFFNAREPLAETIDWGGAAVQEKLDGTLCVLYPRGNGWAVSTKGDPDASGPSKTPGLTIAQLFWQVWGISGYPDPKKLNGLCLMFELVGPSNKHVVHYQKNRLVLLGARELRFLQEADPAPIAHRFGFDTPKLTKLKDLTGVRAAAAKNKARDAEGFVVVDKRFRRIKVKGPDYVLHHKHIDQITDTDIVHAWQEGRIDDLLGTFPEYAERVEQLVERFERLFHSTLDFHLLIQDVDDPKRFAELAARHPASDWIFKLHKRKTSLWSIFTEIGPKRAQKVLASFTALGPDFETKTLLKPGDLGEFDLAVEEPTVVEEPAEGPTPWEKVEAGHYVAGPWTIKKTDAGEWELLESGVVRADFRTLGAAKASLEG